MCVGLLKEIQGEDDGNTDDTEIYHHNNEEEEGELNDKDKKKGS